jgi:hypothetical protein
MTLYYATVSVGVPDGTPDSECDKLFEAIDSRFEETVEAYLDRAILSVDTSVPCNVEVA